LFTGDRSEIDSVLNKTMICVSPSRWNGVVAYLMRSAHAIQLISMIFVAGQKGWDGIALVVLLAVNSLVCYTSNNDIVVRK
jgi:hypothetical protein